MIEAAGEAAGGSSGSRLRRIGPFAAIFLVAFIANLAESLRAGRLSGPPRYSDINYLADALDRLLFESGTGLLSVFGSVLSTPPHALFSTLTAMSGFWLLGPAPLSAYIANAWVLALFVGMMAWLSRPLGGTTARVLFVLVLVYLPVAQSMVSEFRPDAGGGLLFAIALGLICTTDFRKATVRRRLLVAAVGTVATIAKPSAFILTIPGLGVAVLVAMLAQGLLVRNGQQRALATGGLVSVGLYVAMLAPFALVLGPGAVAYVYTVLVTQADIWQTPGDRWFHLTFHLFGVGGQVALGYFRFVGLALILSDIALYARQPDYRRRGALPFAISLAIIYLAMALSNEKTVYQGSFFYLPFVFASADAFVRLALEAKRRWPDIGRVAVNGALGAALAASILWLPFSSGYSYRQPDRAEAIVLMPRATDTIVGLYRGERPTSPECRDRRPVIAATQTVPLVGLAVQMELARAGIRVRTAEPHLLRTKEEAEQALGQMDFVLTADPAAPPAVMKYPLSPYLGDVFRYLDSLPNMQKVRIGTYRGEPFWLFANTHCRGNPAADRPSAESFEADGACRRHCESAHRPQMSPENVSQASIRPDW